MNMVVLGGLKMTMVPTCAASMGMGSNLSPLNLRMDLHPMEWDMALLNPSVRVLQLSSTCITKIQKITRNANKMSFRKSNLLFRPHSKSDKIKIYIS